MRCFLYLALVLGLLSCDDAPRTHPAAEPSPPSPATAAPAAPKPAALSERSVPPPPAPPRGSYELLGILDPGINNMVAFALKKPRDWQVQQSFTRQWKGSAPYNQIYVAMRSPDGNDQIEYLPSSAYFYTDGPMTRNLRATAQQYGGVPPTPGELAPMPPLAYLRQVLLPQLTQHGLPLRVTGAHEMPAHRKGSATLTEAYLEGTLANGHSARLNCLISLITTAVNGEQYYNWEASPALIQSRDHLASCYAHVGVARQSLTVNPAWAQQNQQLVTTGNQVNHDIAQRNYEIQRDVQQHRQKTYAAIHDNQQASADRRNAAFDDALTGQARYDDPTTGERVRTDDYSHVYRDRQGSYFGSNTPIEAGQVDWQELQRVSSVKDY